MRDLLAVETLAEARAWAKFKKQPTLLTERVAPPIEVIELNLDSAFESG